MYVLKPKDLLPGNSGDTDPPLCVWVLILRNKLNNSSPTLRNRGVVLQNNNIAGWYFNTRVNKLSHPNTMRTVQIIITTYLIYYFKVHGQGGGRWETADLPLECSSNAHFLQNIRDSYMRVLYTYWNSSQIRVGWHETRNACLSLTLSETQGPLVLSDTHGPIAPDTFNSLEVWWEKQVLGV